MTTRFFRFAALSLLAIALTACGTLRGAPSLFDEGESPRATTIAAIEEVLIPTFGRLATAAPILPAPFLDDVEQFAGDAEAIATAYLDATEACVVIDGALQSDASTGRACEHSALMRAFWDVDRLLNEAIARADVDTARAIFVASLFLRRDLKPASGDLISGYRKADDRTREEFQAARKALKEAFDGFRQAAASAQRARVGR